jgi:hypothetical protein
MSFDPRTISQPVYDVLQELRTLPNQSETHLKEQKNQAVELYTYLATWGLLRLKAEEVVLQEGKRQVVEKFFQCLQMLSGIENLSVNNLVQELDTLKQLSVEEYLGLTGLGLTLAREFSFWAEAVYQGIQPGD